MTEKRRSGKRRFSEAERSAACAIIKRFGGHVTAACGIECRHSLNKHVSDVTLRLWYDEWLHPEGSNDSAKEAYSEGAGTASFQKLGTTQESSEEQSGLASLDEGEKVERALRIRLDYLAGGRHGDDPQVMAVVDKLMDQRRKADDFTVVAPYIASIRILFAACEVIGIDPRFALEDLAAEINKRIAENGPGVFLLSNGEPTTYEITMADPASLPSGGA